MSEDDVPKIPLPDGWCWHRCGGPWMIASVPTGTILVWSHEDGIQVIKGIDGGPVPPLDVYQAFVELRLQERLALAEDET